MDNLSIFTYYLARRCNKCECPVYSSVILHCPFRDSFDKHFCDDVTPQMWEDWLLEVNDDEE